MPLAARADVRLGAEHVRGIPELERSGAKQRCSRLDSYLIDHFLRPGAHASTSGLPAFDAFTFDRVVNGAVAACRHDSDRLYLLLVEDNTLRRLTVAPGEWAHPDCKPFVDYGEESQDDPVSIDWMHQLARLHGVDDSERLRRHDAQCPGEDLAGLSASDPMMVAHHPM